MRPLPASQNPISPTDLTILTDWEEWMHAQSWSEKTIRQRREFIERVGRDTGMSPTALTTRDVRTFLAGQSFGPATRRLYWRYLRLWSGWLLDEGHRDDDPTAKIPRPKTAPTNLHALTAAHVHAVLGAGMRQRTRSMIMLAAYQGLRASEIAKFRGDDIDVIGQTLFVDGKGGVREHLPLHPLVAEQAALYGDGWWFPGTDNGHVHGESVSDVVGDVMRRAKVNGTCHSLRHWFASELLRQGVDIRVIQQLMRHASLATTQRYLHVDDTQRRAGLLLLPDVTPPKKRKAATKATPAVAAA